MVHQRIDESIPWTSVQRKQESDAIAPAVQKKPDALPTADVETQTQEPGSRFNHNFAQIPLHSPDAPASASYKVIADRQRIPFTPATQRTPMPLQAKLTIGQPEDRYEQEADRVASQVVKQIHAPAQSALGQSVQRHGDPEDLQAKPNISSLQRSPSLAVGEAIAGGEASPDLASTLNRAGSGQPLDPALQQSMGQAMGADFSRVRVHTDERADQLNRSLQAKAFTTGQDVFFRQGTYEPSSLGGQKLIAHELTHVVQQREGAASQSPPTQIQRLIIDGEKVVKESEFWDAVVAAGKPPNRRNPYGLEPNRDLCSYIYKHYTYICSKDKVAVTTAVRAYWRAMTAGRDRQNVSQSVKQGFLTEQFESKQNARMCKKLLSGVPADALLIFRGTNPVQAAQILINKSMGGEESAGADLPNPGEKAAKAQTGDNIKETAGGRIEEWSWKEGGLTGFSTEGVMLIACVKKSSVAFTKLTIGEMGVTGYAKQPLMGVAILSFGNKSVAPPEILFFEEAKKEFLASVGTPDKTQAKAPSSPAVLPTSGSKPIDKFFT
jgi:Domain of unknown function (DUF4157)